jgi:hypothetical protein
MSAISTRQPAVTVEYDTKGTRTTKDFEADKVAAARRFYTAKLNAGKNPTVRGQAAADVAPANADAASDPEVQELADAVNNAAVGNTSPATLKIPGVDMTAKTRAYVAGLIIKRHGLDAGVTPRMVAETDKEYGHANPRQSEFMLKIAWHAARAILASP